MTNDMPDQIKPVVAPRKAPAQANMATAPVPSTTAASRKKSKRNKAGRQADTAADLITRSGDTPRASRSRPKAKVRAADEEFITSTQPQARPKRKRKRVILADDEEEDDAPEPSVKKTRPEEDPAEALEQTQGEEPEAEPDEEPDEGPDEGPDEVHQGFYRTFNVPRNPVGTAFANYRGEPSMAQRRRAFLNQNNQMQRSDYSPGSFWGNVLMRW